MSFTATLAPISDVLLLSRLGLALLAGTIIGWERESQDKPAGLRTNILVSFGSALFVLIPIQLGAAQDNPDFLGRVISSVISGVGFIGAGTIIHSSRVRGLTSAAAIWVSAALGITMACGLWVIGLIGIVVTWIVLSLLDRIESHL